MRALGVSCSLRWGGQLPLHSPSSLAHMQTVLLWVSVAPPVFFLFFFGWDKRIFNAQVQQ